MHTNRAFVCEGKCFCIQRHTSLFFPFGAEGCLLTAKMKHGRCFSEMPGVYLGLRDDLTKIAPKNANMYPTLVDLTKITP